jgi:hypothetical protein
MTKGERVYKDMKDFLWGKDCLGEREIDDIRYGHGQRGNNIEECKEIKILGQEKHTSRGSKLMNLIDCI